MAIKKCDMVKLFGAQMECVDCGAVWDMNDTPPEECVELPRVVTCNTCMQTYDIRGHDHVCPAMACPAPVADKPTPRRMSANCKECHNFTLVSRDMGVCERCLKGAGPTRQPTDKRFDLIPGDVMAEIAKVFAAGAAKYGDYNWQKARMFGDMDPINHAVKHIMYYNAGVADDEDPDGVDMEIHLRHAITNLMFELYYQLHPDEFGDRFNGKTIKVVK